MLLHTGIIWALLFFLEFTWAAPASSCQPSHSSFLISALQRLLPSSFTRHKSPSKSTSSRAKSLLSTFQKTYESNTHSFLLQSTQSSCTPSNIAVRRSWDDLSTPERVAYISAVQCMTTLPSLTPSHLAPGARNRLDDFVYAHINVTNYIHLSGLLLPWHRQFIWSWEQALRNDCGYSGYLPYWDWASHSDNQSANPVFGSGPDAFGTNGESVPHNMSATSPLIGLPPPGVTVPRVTGTGGGCVKDGPFKDMTLHLGPVSPSYNTIPDNKFGTQYNPRCLKRDFHQPSSAGNMTYEAIAELLQTRSIREFRPLMEHHTGVHISGHNFLGGDGGDTYSSPNEPLFMLHHAQIDRLWTLWQGQDIGGRRSAVDGTVTVANVPPSEDATLDTVMKMGAPAGGDLTIGQAMLTVGNDYCYIYV